MNTTQEIHGHEVIHMIAESGVSYTRATLKEAIIAKFGGETRFFTCSANNMTAEDLIEFLAQRGKLVGSEDGFTSSADHVCSH